MKLRLQIVFLALAFTSVGASAQIGFFVNPVVTRVSNSADPGNFSYLGPGKTERLFGGVDFGVYYDAYHVDNLGLGLEIRDEVSNGSGAFLNNLLVGARISARKPTWRFHPYVEPTFGYGKSRAPNTGIYVSKSEFGIYGGTDFKLQKHIDWRVLEVGYATLATASDATIGGLYPVSKSNLITFSTGFVFRFR